MRMLAEDLSQMTDQTLIDAAFSDAQIVATMLAHDEITTVAARFHSYLHHGCAKHSCLLQFSAIATLMAKMFQAGYAAGRQEIIDGEVAKMTATEKAG